MDGVHQPYGNLEQKHGSLFGTKISLSTSKLGGEIKSFFDNMTFELLYKGKISLAVKDYPQNHE